MGLMSKPDFGQSENPENAMAAPEQPRATHRSSPPKKISPDLAPPSCHMPFDAEPQWSWRCLIFPVVISLIVILWGWFVR